MDVMILEDFLSMKETVKMMLKLSFTSFEVHRTDKI